MGEFSVWHILILAVIVMVLFGYKKLPSASKAIAQSLRIFKDETKGLRGEDETTVATVAVPVQAAIPATVPAQVPLQVQVPVAAPAPAPVPVAVPVVAQPVSQVVGSSVLAAPGAQQHTQS